MTARLLFNGRETAAAAFDDAARRAAGGFERLGVGEGDVVCILLHNRPAFLEAAFGARLLGAYSCPINWHYKADEAGWILSDSGAKALITDAQLRHQIAAGLPAGIAIIDNWESWIADCAPWSGEPRTPRYSMP